MMEAQMIAAAPAVQPAPTATAEREGLYAASRDAASPWVWASALARRIADADDADAATWRSMLAAIEAGDRAQLAATLTDDLRAELYGAQGRASSADLVALGLLDQASRVRELMPSVPSASVHLAEAIRAYGDFLALRHPRGQTAPVPAIADHHPFEDAIDPSSPAVEPPTGIRLPDLEIHRFGEAEVEARAEQERQATRQAVQRHVRRGVRTVKREWGFFGGLAAVAVGVGTALWTAFGGRP